MKLEDKSRCEVMPHSKRNPAKDLAKDNIVERKDIGIASMVLPKPKPTQIQAFVPPLPRQRGESHKKNLANVAGYRRRRAKRAEKAATRARREAEQARERKEQAKGEMVQMPAREQIRQQQAAIIAAAVRGRRTRQRQRQAAIITAAARGMKIREMQRAFGKGRLRRQQQALYDEMVSAVLEQLRQGTARIGCTRVCTDLRAINERSTIYREAKEALEIDHSMDLD